MERLTTRHCGVAVIKDKNKLKEAMEKLAAYEDAEQVAVCEGYGSSSGILEGQMEISDYPGIVPEEVAVNE